MILLPKKTSFCYLSEESKFFFSTFEHNDLVFSKSYKKIVTQKWAKILEFTSTPDNNQLYIKSMQLKNKLWKESKIPIFVKSVGYKEIDGLIATLVEVHCLENQLDQIKLEIVNSNCLRLNDQIY